MIVLDLSVQFSSQYQVWLWASMVQKGEELEKNCHKVKCWLKKTASIGVGPIQISSFLDFLLKFEKIKKITFFQWWGSGGKIEKIIFFQIFPNRTFKYCFLGISMDPNNGKIPMTVEGKRNYLISSLPGAWTPSLTNNIARRKFLQKD